MAATLWNGYQLYVELYTTSWQDITSYVRSVDMQRGRSTELDTFQPGTLSMVLDNSDRRFDPTYTSSPYNGYIVPRAQVRVRVEVLTLTVAVLFTGRVSSWPQTYDLGGHYAECNVTAVDDMATLARRRLPESLYRTQLLSESPWAYWPLGEDPSSSVFIDYSGNGRDGYKPPVFQSTASLVNGSGYASQVYEPGTAYYGAEAPSTYTLEMWVRAPSTPPASGGVYVPFASSRRSGLMHQLAIIADSSLGNGNFAVLSYNGTTRYDARTSTQICDGQPHHIVIVTTSTTASPTVYVDGVAATTSTASSANTTAVTGSALYMFWPGWDTALFDERPVVVFDEVSVWSSALSASTVSTHYSLGVTPGYGDTTCARASRVLTAVGWSGSTTIGTGLTQLGAYVGDSAGSLLSYLQQLELTEQGQLYIDGSGYLVFRDRWWRYSDSSATTPQATFGDSGSEYPYTDLVLSYDDRFMANASTITAASGTPVTASDSTSISTYGELTESVSGTLHQSSAEALALAQYRVARRKDPAVRVESLTINPRASSDINVFRACVLRDVGNRITVKRRPQGVGSAISGDYHIEGVGHRIADGATTWETTWWLSPVDDTTWFKFDTAGRGFDDGKLFY